MNNTMKNLKDEIEEILADYEIMRTLTLQGIEQTYKGGVVEELVQALTSLIEQENEQFLIRFKDYVFKQPMNVKLWHEYIEQYLAERKG